MTRTVKRKPKPTQDVGLLVKTYVGFKRMVDEVNEQFNLAKKNLKAYVDEHGIVDDKGHRWIEEPGVEGVKAIKHERRVSVALDETVAFEMLKQRDLLDRCAHTLVVLDGYYDSDEISELLRNADPTSRAGEASVVDVNHALNEDEIYACVFDDDANLTEDDVKEMTKTKETWALKVEAT